MTTARILFVCTGNICRSPTAEAVLRRMVEDTGLAGRVEADSAGTGGWHVGMPPDSRAVRAGARRGYDLSFLRARQLSVQDYATFDLLVGLDRGHRRHLTARRPPKAPGSICLLLDFAPDAVRQNGTDVPDPYFGGPADFERALDLIEVGAAGLLESLRRDDL